MAVSISGQWKGYFWYGKEYGELEGESVEFMMFLNEQNGEINGKCFEMGGVGVAEGADLAVINGFVKDRQISFIKKYNHATFFDEDGNAQIDALKPSQEIHYEGEFEVSEYQFTGTWEIVERSEIYGDCFVEYICTGTWMMKKENDI
ncbi:hypothetical protein [Lacibacter sediminis]|uniref:DUF1579 domain-containing protein n=1 Tax=Lacibacter sediminis TaxID=2760713 RepID=A0A7G5XKL0_9BACT|nr:hypothetical protein [Lacibacter sediminis]QNA46013.1 hypothetical protein H4075_07465 [Lacibacter sediminis]